MDGRANPLMDRKVVGVVFLNWLQWSPKPEVLDVVWCSVVQCSCRCSVAVAVAVVDVVVLML